MVKSLERRTLKGCRLKNKNMCLYLYEDVYFDPSAAPQITSDFKIILQDTETKATFKLNTFKIWGEGLDFFNSYLNKLKQD